MALAQPMQATKLPMFICTVVTTSAFLWCSVQVGSHIHGFCIHDFNYPWLLVGVGRDSIFILTLGHFQTTFGCGWTARTQ